MRCRAEAYEPLPSFNHLPSWQQASEYEREQQTAAASRAIEELLRAFDETKGVSRR